MNNLIILFQTPYNTVKYMTSNLSSPAFLGYYKFIEYIQTLSINDYAGFIDELDKFKTIVINLDDHSWTVHKEERKEATFEQLLELNKGEEEEKEKTKIERAKESIKKFAKKSIKDIIGVDNSDPRNKYR